MQDVQHLLAPDAATTSCVAMWMLYHVPDLDRGLAELRRVLRPGGTLVAVTNGDEHVADLRREAGGVAGGDDVQQRERRGGPAPALRRRRRRDDLETRAVFPDRDAALAYLRSSGRGRSTGHCPRTAGRASTPAT